MALTTARKKANAKYEAKAYDKTLIRLPKGRLDEIRAHIEPAGESLNGFIGRAILETMERDGSGAVAPGTAPVERVLAETAPTSSQQPAETAQGAGGIPVSPDTLEAAERAAKRTGETVAAFVARAVVDQEKRDDKAFKLGISPA